MSQSSDNLPGVTVALSAYNRRPMVELLLAGYERQSYRNFEVIVCDDGSSDGTQELVERRRREVSYPLRLFTWEDLGYRKAGVLNAGLALARNPFVAFTDDDCIPHRDFVLGQARQARRGHFSLGKVVKISRADMRYANVEAIRAGRMDRLLTPLVRLDLWLWHIKYHQWLLCRTKDRPKMNGANFGVWRRDMLAVNGLDNSFVGYGYEDNDLRRRLLANGLKIQVVVREAVLFHLWEEQKNYEVGTAGVKNKAYANRPDSPTVCLDGVRQTAEREGLEILPTTE